jgi:hypothetical protein
MPATKPANIRMAQLTGQRRSSKSRSRDSRDVRVCGVALSCRLSAIMGAPFVDYWLRDVGRTSVSKQ